MVSKIHMNGIESAMVDFFLVAAAYIFYDLSGKSGRKCS